MSQSYAHRVRQCACTIRNRWKTDRIQPFRFRASIRMVSNAPPPYAKAFDLTQFMTCIGTLTQNSDTVIPNPNPQTRTDITAFSILNVSGTKERQKELMNAIIDIVRRFMANQTVSSPYGFNGMPGYPGGSMPFIVNMPPQPAPVITITNMAPPSSGYSSFVSSK